MSCQAGRPGRLYGWQLPAPSSRPCPYTGVTDTLALPMALTGVLCVILTGKGKMSCYLFGLVNTVLYAWIAFGAKYYGEVMLECLLLSLCSLWDGSCGKKTWTVKTKEVEKTRLYRFKTDTTSGFVRCLHLRLRAGIETIRRKPPLYRQHEHLPVCAGHASQRQAPYGAVDRYGLWWMW